MKNYYPIFFILFCFVGQLSAPLALAQESLDEIEAELERNRPRPQERSEKIEAVSKSEASSKQVEEFVAPSGLNQLIAFSDLAVIQKKYLPKTERFQFHLGLNMSTNNPFFSNSGLTGRLGYNLTEEWGLELSYWLNSSSRREVTQDLSRKGVITTSFIYAKEIYGLDAVWAPFYGKISWLNKKIIPFDLFFSAGLGNITTSYKDQSATAIRLGVGQLFAWSKSTALRWDFNLNSYSANAQSSTGAVRAQGFNDLYISVGMSWFFPEARYR